MESDAFAIASSSWGILSGVAVCALGLLALSGGASRPRGGLAFGLFAIFWGAQVTSGNAAKAMTDAGLASTFYLLLIAFAMPTAYLLVEFAASQDQAPRRRSLWLGARAIIGVASLSAALLFITAPSLVYKGVSVNSTGRIDPVWGPLQPYLIIIPHFLAFGIALLALWRATARAPTPRLRLRAAIPLIGIGIYASFAAANNASFFLAILLPSGSSASWERFGIFTLLFVALTMLVATISVRCWQAARSAASPEDRQVWYAAALALALPLGWGTIEGYLAAGAHPLLDTVGMWRLAGVGFLAYGIAQWRFYDLKQRATRAAAAASGATAAAATGAAAYGAGTLASSSSLVPIGAGLLVMGAALLPAMAFARRLFGVGRAEPRRDLEAALYGQRIDAYRAALEASLARGSLDEDQEFLAALRERFNITADEDRVLSHLARSSVIVARERGAWDAYERLRLLGEGGGGRTWLARDRVRDRLVVLKEPLERWQLEPSAREAVLREARLAAKVRHAHVVAVEEVVEGKGSPVIVMEYMEGGSLSQLLRARGTLPWSEARALILDVLSGLEAVHAGGIVHRDVKPSNILLTGEGIAKIADFGIAVAPHAGGGRTAVIDASHSQVAGTLHYMAPEARAGSDPDKRADVYSSAALLHEMLYGAPPGQASPVVIRQDLPAGLPALFKRALAARPEDRVPTARAMAEEIAKLS